MSLVFDPGAPSRVAQPVRFDDRSVACPARSAGPVDSRDLAQSCSSLLDQVTGARTEIVAVRQTPVGELAMAVVMVRRVTSGGGAGEYRGSTAIRPTPAEAVVAATAQAFGAAQGLFQLTAEWWAGVPGVIRTVAFDDHATGDRLAVLVALAPGEGRLAVDTESTRYRALIGPRQAVVLELDAATGPVDEVERWFDRLESLVDG